MTLLDKDRTELIKNSLSECSLCECIDKPGALCINDKEIGLSYIYPNTVPIEILFIAESPPKPENGFFYDEFYIDLPFRKKLFKLINASGLGQIETLQDFNEKGYYLADAINCRWDKRIKKSLRVAVFKNCSQYLAQQIELLEPNYIVAMGNTARKSLHYSEVEDSIAKIEIPSENITEMSFILVASNERDEDRIKKLTKIAEKIRKQKEKRDILTAYY